MLNIKIGEIYFYVDESSNEIKEVVTDELFLSILEKIEKGDIKSDLLKRCFKTKEEAKEFLLEELGLKLHQALDDKDSILYNIKELKKKINKLNKI